MPRYIYEYVAKRNGYNDERNEFGYNIMSFLHGITETYDDAIKQFNYKMYEMGDRRYEFSCAIIKHILEPLDKRDLFMMKNIDVESLLKIIDDYSDKHIYILDNDYHIIHDYLFFSTEACTMLENVSLYMYNKAKRYITGKRLVDKFTGNEYMITDGFKEDLYSFKRLSYYERLGPTIDIKSVSEDQEEIATDDISRFRILD